MSILLASSISITAPAASDGLGEVAVLNDSASGNFVGHLFAHSGLGGATVRTSMENKPQAHGATFGSFYRGHRPFTLTVLLARASSYANSDARYNKLVKAWNAMAGDGSIVWTDTDGIAKRILFRQETQPDDPNEQRQVLLGGVAANPRIQANTATTAGTGSFSVGGTAGALPTFTLTSPTNTITISRTSPSPTETLTLTGLSGAGTVTVNFEERTVTATSGASDRYSAVSFPSSIWWELAPGVSNTVSVSGATVSGSGISYRTSWLNA